MGSEPNGTDPNDESALLSRYVAEKLRRGDTYVTAIVVGVLINGYGQLLVPWLRGKGDPWQLFIREFDESPGLSLLSVGLGFLFPLLVGVYASVATRWTNRRFESKALFPDAKPDPVFRASFDGTILDAGDTTRALLTRYAVERAPDLLGGSTWEKLVAAARAGRELATRPRIYFEKADAWYLVASSLAPGNNVNVYLTRIAPEQDPQPPTVAEDD